MIVDTLSVLVSADSKKFIAGMNGVIKQTEATQGAFARMYATGIKGAAMFTAAIAAGAVAAAGFGLAVKGVGAQLQKYGADVPATTVKAFSKMEEAMDDASKTISIALGDALARGSDGFIIFTKRVSETITDSTALKTLMEGLSYVFAFVGDTIKSMSLIIGTMINGFQVMAQTTKMLTLEMEEFFYQVDNSDKIGELSASIRALGKESEENLKNAFDMDRFMKSIEDVYSGINKREAERQKLLKDGASKTLSWEALVVEALRKHDKARMESNNQLYVQTLLSQKLLTNDVEFMYEIEAKKTELAKTGADERLANALWAATREEQIMAMKRAAIQSIAVQEAQDTAQMQALWESSWKGKAEILGGVIGGFSVLMETNSKKMFKVGKAAAMADATISAILAANKAYSALAGIPIVGPALGAAAAAAALLAGYANVNKIRATQFGGGGGGGGASFSASAPAAGASAAAGGGGGPSGTSNVNITMVGERFSDSQVRGLIGHINNQLGDNAKLKVKSGG